MLLHWRPSQWMKEHSLICGETDDGTVRLCFAPALEAEGRLLRASEATSEADFSAEKGIWTLRWDSPQLQLRLHLRQEAQTLFLSGEIQNLSSEPIRLGECRLLDITPATGAARLQGDAGQAVYLHLSGTTGQTRVHRAAEPGDRFSVVLLQFFSPEARRALHLGFIPFTNQHTLHRFEYGSNGLQALQSVCDFQDYPLPAGGHIATETLIIEAADDPHESLTRWAERAAAYYQPSIWPKIPAGWLGWAWIDAFNVENYEDVVLRNCRAIRERLPGFDIEYVWVSIGNIQDGYPGNWLAWDYQNFPRGPQYLVQALGELGFRLGFWCGAFWICEAAAEAVAQLRDAFLRREGAPVIASPHWNYGAAARLPAEQRPALLALDPTHPKTREFLTHVFRTYREWGVRYYMIDFLNAVSHPLEGAPYDEHYDRSVLRGPQLLRQGLQIIREAAGPDTYLLSSTGPTLWNVGLMDACRMGNDYGEGRAIQPESYFYPATFVINNPHFWTSHAWASNNMAGYYFTHRRLFLNDSCNVLTLDQPIPLCEAQIVATLFGICGGPVMLGDDIATISEERLNLIRKVFPRTPEIARPVDLFERPAPDYPRLFHNHIVTDWDEWEIVSVLNYDDEPLTLAIDFAKLGLPAEESFRVFEFWNEQYLGVAKETFTAIVPPRSVRVYRIARVRPYPWILGTDMHLLQGLTELQKIRWDEASGTLTGQIMRPPSCSGTLFIVVPPGWAITEPQGWHIAKDGREETLIISRHYVFDGQPQEFSLSARIYDEARARQGRECR